MISLLRRFGSSFIAFALLFVISARIHAEEIWIPPTSQADLGGHEIASNTFWPVTPIGAVRLAWAVPNNLQTFQGAKLVLIPGTPGGAASVNIYVCAAQSGNSVVAGCAGPFAQPFNGTANQLVEVEIGPSIASRIGAPGSNYLTVLAFTTPTTTTDHIVGMRFAFTPTAPAGAATLGANTFSGTQTAPAFVGSGAGLTNLPVPAGVASLGPNTFTGAQTAPSFAGNGSGLTNLPFPAGAATLGANTFTGTQTIDTGNIDLDNSTATAGNITKNGVRFLHNFGTQNTFLGHDAGNATMTGGANTASGFQALFSNSTGNGNTATGQLALHFNTTGANNTATGEGALNQNTTGGSNTAAGALALSANITGSSNAAHGFNALARNSSGDNNTAGGARALFTNTTGTSNTANGAGALQNNTVGNENTVSGVSALIQNTTGSANVAVGAGAGFNATTGSSNIYLGASAAGVAGESGAIYLGVPGTQTKTVIAGIRGTTVGGAEMVVIDATGRLGSGPVAPAVNTVGTNEVINESLTASDLAPNAVGSSELAPDSVTADKVAFNYAGSASEGGAASNLACVGCVDASEVSFSFVGTGANTVTGTQTIDGGNLDLDPSSATAGNVTKNGTAFLHNFGIQNTFLGLNAGNFTMTGQTNVGVGFQALQNNAIGASNTATGFNALRSNTNGNHNVAVGNIALAINTTGGSNTATGSMALSVNTSGSQNTATGVAGLGNNTTGADNTATGANALFANTTGNFNTANGVRTLNVNVSGNLNVAVGNQALDDNTTGNANVALGAFAGGNATTGSNNIYLGANAAGVAGESGAIYLGVPGTQIKTVIAGIRGTTVTGGEMVVIDAAGRLGSGSVTPGPSSVGTNEVIDDSLTAGDLAPNSVGSSELAPDSVSADKVAFPYAASAVEGGAAADLACVGCVSAGEVSFSFAGTGPNTFTATQTIATGNLDLDLSTATTGNITKDGIRFLHTFGGNTFLGLNSGNFTLTGFSNTAAGVNALTSLTTALLNTAVGADALGVNDTGFGNTAVGARALGVNTGGFNTAIGLEALAKNTVAAGNTATGYQALFNNIGGSSNTAMGYEALEANTSGADNTAVGIGAMGASTTGNSNSAFGFLALRLNGAGVRNTGSGGNALFNNTGNDNTAVGFSAGQTATTGSNNIYLGANVLGVAGESNTMYLGKIGVQTKALIAGVRGITTGAGDAIPVVIDSNGQLGTISSSIRFKEDIHDMADASRRMLKLRPVTFRYTQAYINGAKPIQYGLIAEEVADAFPELAVRGADGQVETVHYETLNVLLLNEVQRQQSELHQQQQELDRQQRRIDVLEQRINQLLGER
jgi:hypothetical protein